MNRSTRRGLIVGGAVVAVVVLVAAISAFVAFGGSDDDPEPVEPLNNAVLATSKDLSCAITGNTANGGDLYCWGYGGRGELMLDDGQSTSLEPVQIKDLDFVTAVSIDPYGTVCAISRGDLYCWGANESGQVGNGSTSRSVPAPTKVLGLTGVTAVSSAFESTCAVAGGLVYCWGSSDFQQIPGTRNDTPVPVKIEGIDGAAGLANGGQTVCVLSGGGAYCWGSNNIDPLDDATRDSDLETPSRLPWFSEVSAVATSYQSHLRGRARRGLLLGRQ